MFNKLKSKIPMELRSNSKGNEYVEAVIQKKDIEALTAILVEYMGHPVKKPGKPVKFNSEAQKIVDSIGGIRNEQEFYYCEKDDAIYYAALWPWQSDPLRITLKAGIIKK
jgi:hypothetical protein